MKILLCLSAALFFLPCLGNSFAEEIDQDSLRYYNTPEERRNAGHEFELTEGLTFSPFLELESTLSSFGFTDSAKRYHTDQTVATLQSGLEYYPLEWVKGEIVYEMEFGEKFNDQVDELIVALEYEEFALEFGRSELPFGEYYSHFINGPLLEFSETRADGVIMSYDREGQIEASVFLYKSEHLKHDQYNFKNWGTSAKIALNSSAMMGVGYISDLSDFRNDLLEDGQFFTDSLDIAALNTFLTTDFEPYFFSIEYVQALESHNRADNQSVKPWVLNLEISRAILESLELALRVEWAHDLEDEPKRRYGTALTYRISEAFLWTSEVLYATYSGYEVDEPRAGEVDDEILFAIQFGYGF